MCENLSCADYIRKYKKKMFTADGGGLYYISTRFEREEENNRQHPIRLIWAGAKALSKIFSRYYWRGHSVKGTHLSKWPRKLEST